MMFQIFSEVNSLNSRDIIRGVSLDSRIGDYYNNPSFGYDEYCLPKDTMQLRSNYGNTPDTYYQPTQSNDDRKRFITDRIASMTLHVSATIEVFKLSMKSKSDNSRESSIFDVIKILENSGFNIVIYEPTLKDNNIRYNVIQNLVGFKELSNVIIANRLTDELKDISHKVYSRDVYNRNDSVYVYPFCYAINIGLALIFLIL